MPVGPRREPLPSRRPGRVDRGGRLLVDRRRGEDGGVGRVRGVGRQAPRVLRRAQLRDRAADRAQVVVAGRDPRGDALVEPGRLRVVRAPRDPGVRGVVGQLAGQPTGLGPQLRHPLAGPGGLGFRPAPRRGPSGVPGPGAGQGARQLRDQFLQVVELLVGLVGVALLELLEPAAHLRPPRARPPGRAGPRPPWSACAATSRAPDPSSSATPAATVARRRAQRVRGRARLRAQVGGVGGEERGRRLVRPHQAFERARDGLHVVERPGGLDEQVVVERAQPVGQGVGQLPGIEVLRQLRAAQRQHQRQQLVEPLAAQAEQPRVDGGAVLGGVVAHRVRPHLGDQLLAGQRAVVRGEQREVDARAPVDHEVPALHLVGVPACLQPDPDGDRLAVLRPELHPHVAVTRRTGRGRAGSSASCGLRRRTGSAGGARSARRARTGTAPRAPWSCPSRSARAARAARPRRRTPRRGSPTG